MAEVTKYPTSVTTQAVAPENANDWVNIINIGADDGNDAYITAATYDTNDISYRAKAQNFNFSIPSGATILGIKVEIERRCVAGAAKDYRVQLLDASGALVGDNKASTDAWPSSNATKTYGGSSDTWNASPTPTMVNDADFGVVLSVQATADNTDIYADFIRITIYYSTIHQASATMSGTGSMSAAATLIGIKLATATMSGAGSLAAAARVTRTAKATFTGAGSLAGAARRIRNAAATLSGAGTLAAAARRIRTATATMSGAGSLAAAALATRTAKATMSGAGALAAAAHRTTTAKATMSGEGSMAATATLVGGAIYASATMSGTGSMAAAAHRIRTAAATLSGTGALAAAARLTTTAKATMSGEGSLSAAAIIVTGVIYASASLSGEGTLTARASFYGITAALLAAQKKKTRTPYIELEVHDYEAGIKRLSWSRLYTGSEPDNHHGLAFDGEGSMHRIRSCFQPPASYLLYYQKITNPGPSSDYSQWTEIASDCAGPCAIAAYGSKVYIFYRKTDNTLRKYYSHDFGANWTNAELAPYPDVSHLAACWWGTTDIVVCFALKDATPAKVNGIVLNTQNQSTTTNEWSDGTHPIIQTLGIGATYDWINVQCQLVIAGKQSATPYNHYDLFRTWFSASYHFGALESFLMAPQGEATTYEFPDCHLPANAQPYETTRIVAVEKFTGTTAFTRALSSHRVKGTEWSQTNFTEPRPFLIDIAPSYGFRLQSTQAYWWLSTPSGVWRAQRAAQEPLNLTPHLISFSQSRPGNLVITLDNRKGQYANPGEGALASLRFRAEIKLRLGYVTRNGPQAMDAGTYWIDSWQYSSSANQSFFTITSIDGWGLLKSWSARYQMRWNQSDIDPKNVWQILSRILGRVGIHLTNTPTKPQSSALNNLYPDFTISPGTTGTQAVARLLSFVPDQLVFTGQEAFTKNPLPDEDPCYEYGTDHTILAGSYTEALTPTRTRAIGREPDGDRLLEEATDDDLIALGIDILDQDYDPNLQSATRTQERADAILRKHALQSRGAQITVPVNCAQQLHDVVQLTDHRCGILNQKLRVLTIHTHHDRRQGIYAQRLALCAP